MLAIFAALTVFLAWSASGLKVDAGDRLGKTIIFAKNQAHANFIAERFAQQAQNLHGLARKRAETHLGNVLGG